MPKSGVARIALAIIATSFARIDAKDVTNKKHDLALLNRVSWGASESSWSEIEKLGSTRWLRQQLSPTTSEALPIEAKAQIDAMPIANASLIQLVNESDGYRTKINEAMDIETRVSAKAAYQHHLSELSYQFYTRSMLRLVYGRDQLRQRMTWFWMNHFSIGMQKRDIQAMIGDYEDSAIRPYALGRFRDLLEATLRHPAMLRYLDNERNSKGHLNENYAREIMELHTLGLAQGYSQNDVHELARILTGVGINSKTTGKLFRPSRNGLYIRDGLFEFDPARHDFGNKVFLGTEIKGSGFNEVDQALDLIARDPATARHISNQIACLFVSDNPPTALVDRMASAFLRYDGDIAIVLHVMFQSKEFNASLEVPKSKDPLDFVISGLRLKYDRQVLTSFKSPRVWLRLLGHGLFLRKTPDGYPDSALSWNAPGQMIARFNVARALARTPTTAVAPSGRTLPAKVIAISPLNTREC